MTRLLRTIGARCAARPLVVIAVWLCVVAGVVALAATVGGRYTTHASLPGTEVDVAERVLSAHLRAASYESADVVVHAPTPVAAERAVTALTADVRRLPHVTSAGAPTRWSADRSTALVHVTYDVPRFDLGHGALVALRRAAQRAPGAEAYVTGSLARNAARPSGGLAEKIGVGAAVLVLLLAFGSVIAALMPVATAAVAIVTGLALVQLLANLYRFNDTAPQLATMMGLGVGIDYALFVVTRHREALAAGAVPAVAAATATATAGSSVLWAGVTVVAAICGLAFAGIPVVTSLGLASAVVVACSVAASLTLLPALLSLTGSHLEQLHLGLPWHRRHPHDAPGWAGWARRIERHPLPFVIGPALLLVVLAVPAGAMRLGAPDAGSATHGSDDYKAFTLTSRAFGPGANAPLTLVVEPATAWRPVATAVEAAPGVAAVAPPELSPDGAVAVIEVQPTTAPADAATQSLVRRLRQRVLPPVERVHAASVYVSGFAAGRFDIGRRVLQRLPWFVGAVLAVSFLLLMVVFRSLLVPLKAVLLNLLSIAAALGVTVAIFTWGWLRSLVGLTEAVPIEDVVPLLMFAIVFGLSMDYEVFLLSRVREEWALDGDSRGSVVRGLTSTARVISAAAGIMVSVFFAFTLASDVTVKMIGLGLAVAIFLDATVIRLVLVPATMALLGDLNWWLPRWLDRLLPHVDVDGAVPVTPAYDGGRRQATDAPMPRPTA